MNKLFTSFAIAMALLTPAFAQAEKAVRVPQVGDPVSITYGGSIPPAASRILALSEEFVALYYGGAASWVPRSVLRRTDQGMLTVVYTAGSPTQPERLPPHTRVGGLVYLSPDRYNISSRVPGYKITRDRFTAHVTSADQTGASLEFLGMTRQVETGKFKYGPNYVLQVDLNDFLDPNYTPPKAGELKPGDPLLLQAGSRQSKNTLLTVKTVTPTEYITDYWNFRYKKSDVHDLPGFPYPVVDLNKRL